MDFQIAAASFGLLLVMELGDKTQLAVLSLTARTGRVLAVFAGSALALITVTLIGVTVGAAAGEFIPIEWLSRITGLAFIAIGGLMLWQSRPGAVEEEEEKTDQPGPRARGFLGTLAISFGVPFVAEMGDKSQLAVVSLSAQTGSPLSVFLGASLALTLATFLGALAGKALARVIPLQWVSRGAGLLFIIIGALTLAGIF